MADNTKIEWTDATWNPVTGCTVVSPGCTNCYAMKLAGGRLRHHPSRKGLTDGSKAGPVWNGKVRFNHVWLDQPLKWKRPRMIFVCAHGDLFHEAIPDEWIDVVFAVMALAKQHTFQVLTKRPERMRDYLKQVASERDMNRWAIAASRIRPDWFSSMIDEKIAEADWPLRNVWLGVSAEDQVRADMRVGPLLETPAAIRFVSAEPLLDLVTFECMVFDKWPESTGIIPGYSGTYNALAGTWMPAVGNVDEELAGRLLELPKLDWIIVGGEGGPRARPMHPDWALRLRDECRNNEVPFHFKQWGRYMPAESRIVGNRIIMGRNGHVRPSGAESLYDDDWILADVGKARAGRLLYDRNDRHREHARTWDELPEVSVDDF